VSSGLATHPHLSDNTRFHPNRLVPRYNKLTFARPLQSVSAIHIPTNIFLLGAFSQILHYFYFYYNIAGDRVVEISRLLSPLPLFSKYSLTKISIWILKLFSILVKESYFNFYNNIEGCWIVVELPIRVPYYFPKNSLSNILVI